MFFYEDIFYNLNKDKVRYIVAGGVAVNLHGVPRVTADLDILLDLSKKNIEKFAKVMLKLRYLPKVPVKIEDLAVKENRRDWINNKNMRVFTLFNKKIPYKEVDIFVENPIPFNSLYKSKDVISVGGLKIPIVSIRDLIKLKEIAARLQDISDIKLLKRVIRLQRQVR